MLIKLKQVLRKLIKLRKFFTHCQLKEVFIKLKQVSGIKRELKENNFVPWMICEPNEKEGKEIVGGDNERRKLRAI